ncbi:MAG: hypothetical protein R2802_04190 [Flavobacteriaceae bacterium]|nr:hypothetical protein [Mangrovimonas sp.]MCB0469925.1 hypothetical protein [Flavobacteriaceae bacterium]MCB0432590.1 hypothetical protein [Mangrovimonas sp.]MCB0435244.1 hypothetical protein [Mangrovimonas sp.]MCB0439510.1 hypothetical protein [Mangrovimonas sp.]
MSQIEDSVSSLEQKILKVLQLNKQLKIKCLELQQEIEVCQQQISNKNQEIISWQEQYETLKVANSLLGSDENKRETKLKINALIREIDHCIAQLSE